MEHHQKDFERAALLISQGYLESAYLILARIPLPRHCNASTSSQTDLDVLSTRAQEQRLHVLGSIAGGQCREGSARLKGAFDRDAHNNACDVRVFCLSDLHVDQAEGRLALLEGIHPSDFMNDVLIVPGKVPSPHRLMTHTDALMPKTICGIKNYRERRQRMCVIQFCN